MYCDSVKLYLGASYINDAEHNFFKRSITNTYESLGLVSVERFIDAFEYHEQL